MKNIEIGLQMYTVRKFQADRQQFIDTLDKISAIGYKVIQGGCPNYMTMDEFEGLLKERGMKLCSWGGSYDDMLADPAAIEEAVKMSRRFGVTHITVGTIPVPMRNKEGFKEYAAGMNKIGKELKKEGMWLSYHSHALEFVNFDDCTGMDIFVNETDPECVAFCVDTHWLQSGGVTPQDYIKKLDGRVELVHFKDYGIDFTSMLEAVPKMFAEIGKGNLDWPKIIKVCHECNTKYVIVEQDECKGSPFDSIKISYDNLKKFGV